MDINGDGHRDILSGSYSRQDRDMAGLFQVLYGNANGTFKTAEVLKGTDGQPLIIPAKGEQQLTEKICTRPFAVDWDGDGKLDLVVGNFSGTFYWFKGEGKGKFAPKPELIKSGDVALKIKGYHSDPFVIDWDGDGDLDLLSGSSEGGVQWAENRAGKGKTPDLKPFESLIKPGNAALNWQPVHDNDIKGPMRATRVWVDDINGDGKLDLLVGDSVTVVTPAKGLSDEEFKKKHAAWQEEFKKVQASLTSAGGDPKAQAKAVAELNNLNSRRNEFMKQEMTGFVWLYVQK